MYIDVRCYGTEYLPTKIRENPNIYRLKIKRSYTNYFKLLQHRKK